MKQETFDLILGLAVLALGIGLLLSTFASALALAANPGRFILDQLPAQQQAQGPSASFTWSSNGFNLTVQDTSRSGANPITKWEWDFGDNSGLTSGQNPPTHVYANSGPYTVTLTATDSNNRQSVTFSPVDIVPAQTRSGQSLGDVTANLPSFNLDFAQLLLPVGVGLLTIGLYLAMAVIGGLVTKAGWNLIRPRPETIRIRLKPRHLQQAMEADDAIFAPQTQSPGAGQPAPPPPPPQA